MRTSAITRFLGVLLSAGILAVFIGAIAQPGRANAPTGPMASHTLHVMFDNGSGSAVHIGGGYVLTAAHVVTKSDDKAVLKDSLDVDHNVEVLWSNTDYDVALLRMSDYGRVNAAPLSCRSVHVGEPIRVEGYPFDLKHSIAVPGDVASEAGALYDGTKVSQDLSAMVIPGMSGGPVIDAAGHVIGLNDAVYGQLGPFGVATFGQVNIMVPSTSVCALLARD